MQEFKWSMGSPPQKSAKRYKMEKAQNEDDGHMAIRTALELDNPLSSFRVTKSKRDDVNCKMGERELVGRVGNNPFLAKNNYIEDILIEDNYLRPRKAND